MKPRGKQKKKAREFSKEEGEVDDKQIIAKCGLGGNHREKNMYIKQANGSSLMVRHYRSKFVLMSIITA